MGSEVLRHVRMHATEDVWGYAFRCPGCGETHRLPVKPNEHGWDWNGSTIAPTFSPSILVRMRDTDREHVCHSYVRDGRIEFLADCTHALAGRTVELPAYETGGSDGSSS